ncbi:hypothetical protein CANCADRAFT_12407, partial [Tortispora caseinolytica NRRL Y-17796]
ISKPSSEKPNELLTAEPAEQPAEDENLMRFIHPKPKKPYEVYLDEMEQKLYLAQKQGAALDEDLKNHRLIINKTLQKKLEPSAYVQTERFRHSVKKATPFLRMISRRSLTDAINQCDFSPKRVAQHTGVLLRKAKDHCERLEMGPLSNLYIDQIWACKSGSTLREMKPRGRGRTGIIDHKFIKIYAIIKTSETKARFAEQK